MQILEVIKGDGLVLQGELDELEREEFFRLKKVQAKKKRDGAIQDAEVGL